MNKYIGTKELMATSMTRGEYNEYRGWEVPVNECKADEGYLVEYLDSPNDTCHPNHTNYISWSPKEVFEKSYTLIKDSSVHHSSVTQLLKFFSYEHLPEHLQKISMPFCKLAYVIAEGPSNAETTTALRKLVESKDCAVRAAL